MAYFKNVLRGEPMAKDSMSFLEDFKNPEFITIFVEYFRELGYNLKEDSDIFDLMKKDNQDNGMETLLLFDDGKLCSFIMFQINVLNDWLFKKTEGFIREFFVSPSYRSKGYGKLLLNCKCQHQIGSYHQYEIGSVHKYELPNLFI
jgi:GNAT superfamily N-acetyltransferase